MSRVAAELGVAAVFLFGIRVDPTLLHNLPHSLVVLQSVSLVQLAGL